MEKLFQDEAKQELLDRDGVISIPFLEEDELQQMRDLYAAVHPEGAVPFYRDGGLHMSIWSPDKDYKIRIKEGLHRILRPAAERVYENYRIVTPTFIVKRPGTDSTFPIHQDWNVVDERKHRAFNMWIPLHDVDAENGALWIVKGSQHLPNYIRGAGYLFPKFDSVIDHIRPMMVPIPVKAGHALIFYHRCLHGSPPNQGKSPRAVAAMSVLPEQVPLHIFHQTGEGDPLKVFHPPDDFIYNYENVRDDSPDRPPIGEPVAILPSYKAEPPTKAWFRDMGPEKSTLLRRLQRIFTR